MSDERPGERLQEVTAAIERALGGNQDVKIETHVFIEDKITGQPREFDILITGKVGRHTVTTAIECKDWKRAVDTPQVEAFLTKTQNANIDHRVMVSANGFTDPARKLAHHNNIRLMTLQDVERFPWIGPEVVFVEAQRHFGEMNIHLDFLPGDQPVGEYKVFRGADDEEISVEHLTRCVVNAQFDDDPDLPLSAVRNVIAEYSDPLYVLDSEGARHDVARAYAVTSYHLTHENKPVRLHHYKGEDGDYGVAATSIEAGDIKGDLMMVHDGEKIAVSFQPKKAS